MSSNRSNTSCAGLHYTAKGCGSAVICSTGKLLFSLQHLLASNWGLATFLLNPTCLYTIQPRAVGASVTCSTLGLQTNRFEGFLCVMYWLYHCFHLVVNCFQLFRWKLWTIFTSRRKDSNLYLWLEGQHIYPYTTSAYSQWFSGKVIPAGIEPALADWH